MPERISSPGDESNEQAHGLEDEKLRFENAKKKFFVRLALRLRPAIDAHRSEGVLDLDEKGNRPWGNVTEHCLVEAARVEELSDMAALPADAKEDLLTAAVLHDYFKKGEKEITSAMGGTWESYEESSKVSKEKLANLGFSDRVINLAHSVGSGSLLETESILEKEEIATDDLAFLIMHYVDDYTSGSSWVEGSDPLGERMRKNMENPNYKKIDEEGRSIFNGMSTFEKQLEVGKKIEKRLAAVINDNQGVEIAPDSLPQLVDNKIRDKITALTEEDGQGLQ